jgi:peptidyl-tRNA hydrolase
MKNMTRSRRTVWLVWLTAALGIAIGGLALAGPAANAATGMGWLQLAHLSPNTPPVDVYLYSFGDPNAKIVLHHVAYGDVSPFEHIKAGEYTVAMRAVGAAPKSKPVLSTAVKVIAGHAYTVAGVGPAAGLRLEIFTDRLRAPQHKALVRVIQASMHQDTVTVSFGSKKLGHKLDFPSATGYRALPPGAVTVRVVGPTQHTSDKIQLNADSIYTLVVLDNGAGIKVADLETSMGSKVVPTGPAKTGFGGTAARPGASLLPWAAAALAGLAGVVGGLVLLTRRRRPAMHAR